jgi:hypothetical protein
MIAAHRMRLAPECFRDFRPLSKMRESIQAPAVKRCAQSIGDRDVAENGARYESRRFFDNGRKEPRLISGTVRQNSIWRSK